MVVLVSYAHNEKEDIDIDGASWLEGNCEAGSKHKGTAIRGVPKSRFTMHQMQRASAQLGPIAQWTMDMFLRLIPRDIALR
jgi:hypothetical protein